MENRVTFLNSYNSKTLTCERDRLVENKLEILNRIKTRISGCKF